MQCAVLVEWFDVFCCATTLLLRFLYSAVLIICYILSCVTLILSYYRADKLLSPEFQPLIEDLLGYCHRERQILCFSATFPQQVKAFKDKYLSDAHEINLMDELTLFGMFGLVCLNGGKICRNEFIMTFSYF